MKYYLKYLIILSIFLVGCSPNKPTLEEAKLIFNETELKKWSHCTDSKPITVKYLEVMKVGGFNKKVDAFPLYANIKTKCPDEEAFVIYANEVSIFLREMPSGEFEALVPKFN